MEIAAAGAVRPLVLIAIAIAALLLAGLAAGAAAARGVAEDYPPTGDFIEIDGVRLHYMTTGPEDGPPVLVLHGASGNLHEPRSALEDDLSGYRAIWLDRPGLGWSERPSGDWDPAREAALINAFLDALGHERIAVMGHSWGAAISLRLAMDHPERVGAIVLIAPAIRAWVGEAALYNKATHWPVIGTVITRIIAPTIGRSRIEDGVKSAFSPEPVPDDYVERARLPLILRASNWKANAADMAEVNTHLAAQEGRYDEITAPAIILAGPPDTVVATHRHAEPVAETMPSAELRLIEEAGHNLHHHHGEAVRAALDAVAAEAGLTP